MATRFRLEVSYDGTGFAGWQVQPRERTVQGELGRVFSRLGEDVLPTGAGRTDAGVHSLALTTHVDLDREWADQDLFRAVDSLVPPDIRVLAVSRADPDFHSRFNAGSRTYHYALALLHNPFFRFRRWVPGQVPDPEWATEALANLVGDDDFESFAKSGSSQETSRCRLIAASWRSYAEGAVLSVTANRFLYGMVRAVTGSLVRGFRESKSPRHLRDVLEEKDRAAAGEAAPAAGLYLAGVSYEGDPEVVDRTEMVAKLAGLGEPVHEVMDPDGQKAKNDV
jgi:tRNA pseudouridine38-40 synthase